MKHVFFLTSFFLLSLPFFAHAAEGDVLMSEIAWAGSSISNADEWIELVNLTSEDISLSGWSLSGAATGGGTLLFPDEVVISASSTFVIANYGADHENSSLLHEPNWATTSVSLSNSALELSLMNAEGILIDTVGDGGVPPAGYSGEVRASMHRVFELDGTPLWETSVNSKGFKVGITDFGSPGLFSFSPTEESVPDEVPEESPLPEEEPKPAKPDPIITAIRISEIYPAPLSGEDEWIELVNISSVGEFLDGWTIEDEKGGATILEGLILPWDRIVVISPKGTLNNSGDIVLLKDGKGRIVDGMSYGSSVIGAFPHAPKLSRGESLIRPEYGERFVTTLTPTPGEPNIEDAHPEPTATPPPPPQEHVSVPTIPKIIAPVITTIKKEAPLAKKVLTLSQTKKSTPVVKKIISRRRYKGSSFIATIAVPPGIYGKTRMRVFVDEELRALHLTKTPTTSFHPGERIGFVAQTKESGGTEFLLANVNSLYHLDEGVPFEFLETASWPESSGTYRMQGEVRSVEGRSLRLGVGGEEGIIHAPKSLQGRGLEEGDRVEVLGFFSPGTIPELVMPHDEALTSLEPIHLLKEESRSFPRWAGFSLLAFIVIGGAAFHLHQEKRAYLAQESHN